MVFWLGHWHVVKSSLSEVQLHLNTVLRLWFSSLLNKNHQGGTWVAQ